MNTKIQRIDDTSLTKISNVVAMNILALFTDTPESLNQIYNVACGEMTSLNELTEIISQIMGKPVIVEHGPERAGDVRFSLANISKAEELLGYSPTTTLGEGLSKTVKWMRSFDN